ncbi:MAG TPA: protein kinase, partial [Chroococcales cyanobacterium]
FGQRENGDPYYIMDLVSGPSLADRLKEDGPLKLDELIDIMIPICEALQHAHDNGTVHRDLKPGNIVLAQEGDRTVPKIIDFGIARLMQVETGEQANLTKTGEIFGTPKYMSPEQCMGLKVDHRSDIYSLGCVIFESLTGDAPFMAETPLATMLLHQNSQPMSLKEATLGAEFPPILEACLAKMLAKSPADRHQNCLQIANDFHLLKRKHSAAEKDENSMAPVIAAAKIAINRKPVWITITILVVGIICSGIYLSLSSHISTNTAIHGVVDISSAETTPVVPTPHVDPHASLTPAPPFSHIAGNKRIFSFGKNSVGRLVLDPDDGKTDSLDAHGEITVPVHARIYFITYWDKILNTRALGRFRKGELYAVIIHRKTGTDLFYSDDYDRAYDDELAFARNLGDLHVLEVSESPITIAGLQAMQLEKFKSLAQLNLANTKVDLKKFCQLPILQHLISLNISGMDDALQVVGTLLKMPDRQLKVLNVGACHLKDADIELLTKLNLEALVISDNKITDDGIKTLQKAKTLRTLLIQNLPKVTPRSISYLTSMAHNGLGTI